LPNAFDSGTQNRKDVMTSKKRLPHLPNYQSVSVCMFVHYYIKGRKPNDPLTCQKRGQDTQKCCLYDYAFCHNK